MLELAALGVLRADIQQADTGPLDAHQFFGIEAAHIGKLQEVLCRTLDIGAAVNEHDAVLARGQDRGQRRPANAADAFDSQGGPCQQSPGASRRDDRIPGALLQKAQRNRHGRVLLAAGRRGGFVLHGNNLTGINHRNLCFLLFTQAGKDILPASDQGDVHPQLGLCTQGTANDLLRGVIAAHGVNNHSHIWKTSFFSSSSRISSERREISAFLFRLPFTL